MTDHASTENCPCCLGCLAPGPDTDRALVLAFIAGVTARDQNVPMARALCRLHADLAHGVPMTYLRRPSGWRAFSNADLVAALAWTALAFLPALAWQAIGEAIRQLANNRR